MGLSRIGVQYVQLLVEWLVKQFMKEEKREATNSDKKFHYSLWKDRKCNAFIKLESEQRLSVKF